ncbi:MAG: DoxX family protein [Chitinophagaceae bacterium]
MSQKTISITGWVLSILLASLFAMSAFMKLTQNESALAQATSMGFDAGTYQLIGIVELAALILFLIPRTGVLGGLLLIAYMGGAIATHLQHQQPVAMAITVQVLLWIAFVLRYPALLFMLFPAAKKFVK